MLSSDSSAQRFTTVVPAVVATGGEQRRPHREPVPGEEGAPGVPAEVRDRLLKMTEQISGTVNMPD